MASTISSCDIDLFWSLTEDQVDWFVHARSPLGGQIALRGLCLSRCTELLTHHHPPRVSISINESQPIGFDRVVPSSIDRLDVGNGGNSEMFAGREGLFADLRGVLKSQSCMSVASRILGEDISSLTCWKQCLDPRAELA
jgi:hypothetical protein